ncbi:MAG: hypothetical protein OXM61_07295 [Candidatus Poribacteria bacterium]|nr:hypothetical protein [Candidatus Poribacteria bacterium]
METHRSKTNYFTNYEGFSDGTANNSIYAECVNHHCRQYIPGGQDRYWQVKTGVYKLYDPETDKEESESAPATTK